MTKQTKNKNYKLFFFASLVIFLFAALFYRFGTNNLSDALQGNSYDVHEQTSEIETSESLNEDEKFIAQNVNKEINLHDSVIIKKTEKPNDIVNCHDYINLLSTLYDIQLKIYKGDNFQKDLLSLTIYDNFSKLINVQKINNSFSEDIMSLEDLKQEFLNIENDIIVQNRLKDNNYTNSIKGFIYKFIFIKKINQRAIAAGSVENEILYIESSLDENNLKKAIEYASKINNRKRNIKLTDWVLKVKNLLQAQSIVENSINSLLNNISCKAEDKKND